MGPLISTVQSSNFPRTWRGRLMQQETPFFLTAGEAERVAASSCLASLPAPTPLKRPPPRPLSSTCSPILPPSLGPPPPLPNAPAPLNPWDASASAPASAASSEQTTSPAALSPRPGSLPGPGSARPKRPRDSFPRRRRGPFSALGGPGNGCRLLIHPAPGPTVDAAAGLGPLAAKPPSCIRAARDMSRPTMAPEPFHLRLPSRLPWPELS